MIQYYILQDKKPVPCLNSDEFWAWRWNNNTHVRLDNVNPTDPDGGACVSTIFLGMNYSLDQNAPPKIFESMIFGGALDSEVLRSSTWEEAEACHEKLLERAMRAAKYPKLRVVD